MHILINWLCFVFFIYFFFLFNFFNFFFFLFWKRKKKAMNESSGPLIITKKYTTTKIKNHIIFFLFLFFVFSRNIDSFFISVRFSQALLKKKKKFEKCVRLRIKSKGNNENKIKFKILKKTKMYIKYKINVPMLTFGKKIFFSSLFL